MAMCYLLTQVDALASNGNICYDRHVMAVYKDIAQAQRDLALFVQAAFEFNQRVTENAAELVTFPGDSTVYTLMGRAFILEECPLH